VAVVLLRAPLADLAGGRQHAVDGETVRDAIAEVEARFPLVSGWMLDERRAIRPHVNVYVNGQLAEGDTPVGSADRIHVLPAITGG
jgi:molybdopterin synthase sulfur carrier subunit